MSHSSSEAARKRRSVVVAEPDLFGALGSPEEGDPELIIHAHRPSVPDQVKAVPGRRTHVIDGGRLVELSEAAARSPREVGVNTSESFTLENCLRFFSPPAPDHRDGSSLTFAM